MQGKWVYIGGGRGSGLRRNCRIAIRTSLPPIAARRVRRRSRPRRPPRSPPPRRRLRPRRQRFPRRSGRSRSASRPSSPRREAENAELRTTLAVRDAVLDSLEVRLAERDDRRRRSCRPARRQRGRARRPAPARSPTLRDVRSFEAKRGALQGRRGGAERRPRRGRPRRGAGPRRDLRAAKAAGRPASPARSRGLGRQVHFDFASARLTPGGQAHAAAAAVAPRRHARSPRVRVIGHTDRVGGPAANRRLAAKRARAVADFLVAAGLPRRPDRDRRHGRGRACPSPPPTASPSR